jgi:hypothetical protein
VAAEGFGGAALPVADGGLVDTHHSGEVSLAEPCLCADAADERGDGGCVGHDGMQARGWLGSFALGSRPGRAWEPGVALIDRQADATGDPESSRTWRRRFDIHSDTLR